MTVLQHSRGRSALCTLCALERRTRSYACVVVIRPTAVPAAFERTRTLNLHVVHAQYARVATPIQSRECCTSWFMLECGACRRAECAWCTLGACAATHTLSHFGARGASAAPNRQHTHRAAQAPTTPGRTRERRPRSRSTAPSVQSAASVLGARVGIGRFLLASVKVRVGTALSGGSRAGAGVVRCASSSISRSD